MPASGTEIIAELGEEHIRTGKPIVYTSGDSVFQIATHKDVVPLPTLYEWSRIARRLLTGEHTVGRVIARPFEGPPGRSSVRPSGGTSPCRRPVRRCSTASRRPTCPCTGWGRSATSSPVKGSPEGRYSDSNDHGVELTLDYLKRPSPAFVFTNLVDFDSKYGHRNDPAGYAKAIEAFDRRLPELVGALDGGVLFITGDHGCDPTSASTDHTRERTPLLAAGLPGGPYEIGTRGSFGDLGHTIAGSPRGRGRGSRGGGLRPPDRVRGMSGGTVDLRVSFMSTVVTANDPGGHAVRVTHRAHLQAGERLRVTLEDPRVVVAHKRDGQTLAAADIQAFVEAYTIGEVSDALAAAFLMASLLRGLDGDETLALTRAMIDSGDTVSFGDLGRPTVDKHSTGGVADGVTLAFAPIAAALGMAVAKLSGRGLGHTGGTLDKLESIPGLRTDLSAEEIARQVTDVGCAVAAQSANLVPADGKLYALRDATATVPSVPLIAASVMSKKLAVKTDLILLDVKAGSGAFMKTPEEAEVLARACLTLARGWGRPADVAVTDMSQPLGDAVGNALDIVEAVGPAPRDVPRQVARARRGLRGEGAGGDGARRPRRGSGAGRARDRRGRGPRTVPPDGRGAGRRPTRGRRSRGSAAEGAGRPPHRGRSRRYARRRGC